MTSSADKTLEELIDEVFRDRTWHAIRIFNGNYRGAVGYHLASLSRDHATATVDQLAADAPASAKLRCLLEHALRLKRPHANPQPQPPACDGAYTDELSDAWLDEQFQPTSNDEFDDILG
jgi:hypothetical protein